MREIPKQCKELEQHAADTGKLCLGLHNILLLGFMESIVKLVELTYAMEILIF